MIIMNNMTDYYEHYNYYERYDYYEHYEHTLKDLSIYKRRYINTVKYMTLLLTHVVDHSGHLEVTSLTSCSLELCRPTIILDAPTESTQTKLHY